jgi:hypothetical protein
MEALIVYSRKLAKTSSTSLKEKSFTITQVGKEKIIIKVYSK